MKLAFSAAGVGVGWGERRGNGARRGKSGANLLECESSFARDAEEAQPGSVLPAAFGLFLNSEAEREHSLGCAVVEQLRTLLHPIPVFHFAGAAQRSVHFIFNLQTPRSGWIRVRFSGVPRGEPPLGSPRSCPYLQGTC